jgi:steroid 5-alpha reductase family enzyme
MISIFNKSAKLYSVKVVISKVMNEKKEDTKLYKAYIVLILSYGFALIIAILMGAIFSFLHPLLMILLADITATIVIFIISSFLKNTSLYDPYWNTAPLIFAIYYLLFPQLVNRNIIRFTIVFVLVSVYSIRLTYNWLKQWKGLHHEDWRYSNYRIKMGKKFWIINLTGLQLMPTIMVYLGSISLYPVLSLSNSPIGIIDVFALIITFIAIFLETLADQQSYKFRRNRNSSQEIITTGLWKYSRHPNYFGEIMFWWGLYIFALASNNLYFWSIIGPIAITILFYVVSIPLMEKRNLERKPDYADYKKKTSKLIPWFLKRRN